MPSFTTILADWLQHADTIREIRRRVFIVEQQVAEELEIDAQDYRYIHALASDGDGNAIGTGRLVLTDGEGRIGRMAVLQAWRRRGVGNAILNLLVDEAKLRGATSVVLHAQTHAEGFYAARGFVAEGGVFEEAGIEHIRMFLAAS